jgi:hypothetical protein
MQTVTEILIDFSASMTGKLILTKSTILNDIIPKLDYSAKIGIKTFAATKDKTPIINTILPLSITNTEQITSAINTLTKPDGNTPIAEAIKNSVKSLAEYPAFDKKIVLITDGDENCGGNYINEVNKAQTNGINCQIHIIGIGLKSEATKQAQTIAELSKGSFSQITLSSGTTYNQTIIRQNLSNFYGAIGTQQPTFKDTPTPVITQPIYPIEETLPKEIIYNNKPDIVKKEKESVSEVEEDAELNERIRKSSEEYLFELLKKKYGSRVRWFNENGESYTDHDFEIIDLDSSNSSIEYFIECKGTLKNKPIFYLTKDEWRLFLNHTKNYQIYFVKNLSENPTHIFIDNLLDWLLKGKVVPYLTEKQIVKEDRVFLTVLEFDNV